MPFIQVNMFSGRPKETRAEFIEKLTDCAVETLGVPREAVRVAINEIDKSNWGIGGVTAEKLGR